MRLLTSQTKTLFTESEHPALTVLFSLEIVLHEATPKMKLLKLLAVCDLGSEDGGCSIRQLSRFSSSTGLTLLDELKHPFTSHGTTQRYKQDYRDACDYIEEELQEDMRLHWHAARLAREITAPETDEERPHPRES